MEENKIKRPNKKLFIGVLLFIVLIVGGVLGFMYFRPQRTSQTTSLARSATLSFLYDEISASLGETVTLDVVLDTGGVSVTGADVILVYDPEAIVMQEIIPADNNLFGAPAEYEVTENIIMQENGQAFFRIHANDAKTPSTTRQGKGAIATVNFAIHPTYEGDKAAILIFKDEEAQNATSRVLIEGYQGSILGDPRSIVIDIN